MERAVRSELPTIPEPAPRPVSRVVVGDCRETMRTLDAGTFACCVTSPPYFGLRDYGHAGQIGLEATPDAYVAALVEVFREARRVLADDGTLWLNLGDSYAGQRGGTQGKDGACAKRSVANAACRKMPGARTGDGLKPKDLIGIPWRVAFALQADGWWLRSDIIWHKPNPMPESVTDRPTKAHEYVFLLSKSDRYFYDAKAIAEPAVAVGRIPCGNRKIDASRRDSARDMSIPVAAERNARTVWSIQSEPYSGAHFATMPSMLAQRCVLAGSRVGDAVIDPFFGSGTVGEVCERTGRRWLGCDLNEDYARLAAERTAQTGLAL